MVADQPDTTTPGFLRLAPLTPALVSIAYLVGLAILLPHHRHQINPDGINYIHIAQAYARGDIGPAVNAYWSPLISWLLAPFASSGADMLWAAKVVTGLGGLALTLAGWALFRRFGLSPATTALAAVALSAFALSYAMLVITPDILLSAVLAWYLALTLSPTLLSRPRRALVCGLVAGLAYLAKAYALPFTVLHFAGVCALCVCREGPKSSPAPAVRAMAWFGLGVALIAGPWIGALSWRYGQFTVSTAGSYNHGLVAPGYTGGHQLIGLRPVGGYPDDRTLAAKRPPSWSPLASPQAAVHQLQVMARGVHWFWGMLRDLQADGLSRVALIVSFLAAVLLGMRLARGYLQVWALGTIALFVLGYSMVISDEQRYYWPLIPVLLALVFQWPDWFRIWADGALPGVSGGRKGAAAALAALLLAAACIPWQQPGLSRQDEPQVWLQRAAAEMQRHGVPGPLAADDWFGGLYVSYFLDMPYVGMPEATDPAAIVREARGVGARCFTVFPTAPQMTKTSIPAPDFSGVPGVEKVLEYHDPILGGSNEMTVYRILPCEPARQ